MTTTGNIHEVQTEIVLTVVLGAGRGARLFPLTKSRSEPAVPWGVNHRPEERLDNDLTDFGKQIIPAAIQTRRVFGCVFQGYWEDLGAIRDGMVIIPKDGIVPDGTVI